MSLYDPNFELDSSAFRSYLMFDFQVVDPPRPVLPVISQPRSLEVELDSLLDQVAAHSLKINRGVCPHCYELVRSLPRHIRRHHLKSKVSNESILRPTSLFPARVAN